MGGGTMGYDSNRHFVIGMWVAVVTDWVGSQWWTAAFPTRPQVEKWAGDNLTGQTWSVVLVMGNARVSSDGMANAATADPAAYAAALDDRNRSIATGDYTDE